MRTLEHPEPGTVINGKYRLDRPLGVGGMGAVYSATQIDLGRKVAIKLLHPMFHENADVIERFQREAKLAASIGHDNICEVTDFGTAEDGSPYLVMPVLKGKPFSDVLKDEKMPLERVCDIMGQVLSALDAAHVAGVVHRDLKPDNIFVSRIGDRTDFVKLLDFGISKVMESGAMKELTRTGTVMGTPVYMAPEQARGEKNVDHRLDIYAAGVILYESLTGKRPHDGDSYNEIVFKIIAEPYPPPRALNPSIPKKLEKIVIKAMAKEPSDRFASAKMMGDALGRVRDATLTKHLTKHPVTPMNSGQIVAPRPASLGGSKKRLVPILVMLVLIIAAGMAAAVLFKRTAEIPPYTALAQAPQGEGLAPRSNEQQPAETGRLTMPLPASLPDGDSASGKSVSQDGNSSAVGDGAAKPDRPEETSEGNDGHAAAPSPPTSKSKNPPSSSGPSSDAPKHDSPKKPGNDDEPAKAEPAPESGGNVDDLLHPNPELDLPPAPAPTAPTSPEPTAPAPKSYGHMSDLKAALKKGEISKDEYSKQQGDIRQRRGRELDEAKQAFRSGKLGASQYERLVSEIKRKYETGAPVTVSIPSGSSPAPVPPSAPVSFDNMRELKAALRAGRITKAQYAAAQTEIREKRAEEYERIKADYRSKTISRDEYNKQMDAVRRKYEGN